MLFGIQTSPPIAAIHVASCAFYKIRTLHTFDKNLIDKKTIDVNGFVIYTSRPLTEMLKQSELLIENPEKQQ